MEENGVYTIRQATRQDLPAITAIYNEAVRAGFETAETEEAPAETRKNWFMQHENEAYPIFVCMLAEEVVGWISISAYRQGRQAVRFTVEISYYVRNDFKGQGIGSRLMHHCLDYCRAAGYKTLFAIVIERNEHSFGLLKKFGFREWGRLPLAVDFNGLECDHVYYGRKMS